MTFGEKLKKLRKEKKMSQETLAKALGLSRSAIAKYENNEREPNFESIQKIEKYFNISTNEIINDLHNTDYLIQGKEMFKRVLSFTNPNMLNKVIDNIDIEMQNSVYILVSNFLGVLGDLESNSLDRLYLLIKIGQIIDTIKIKKHGLYFSLSDDLNSINSKNEITQSDLEEYIRFLNDKKSEINNYIDNYIEKFNPTNFNNIIFKKEIDEMEKNYPMDKELYEALKIANEYDNKDKNF